MQQFTYQFTGLKGETKNFLSIGDFFPLSAIDRTAIQKKKKIIKGIDECINKIDIECFIQQQQNIHSFKFTWDVYQVGQNAELQNKF